jgi:hypothetical protein
MKLREAFWAQEHIEGRRSSYFLNFSSINFLQEIATSREYNTSSLKSMDQPKILLLLDSLEQGE